MFLTAFMRHWAEASRECGRLPAIRGFVEDLGPVNIREYCNQLNTELVALRRELHQIPEWVSICR